MNKPNSFRDGRSGTGNHFLFSAKSTLGIATVKTIEREQVSAAIAHAFVLVSAAKE